MWLAALMVGLATLVIPSVLFILAGLTLVMVVAWLVSDALVHRATRYVGHLRPPRWRRLTPRHAAR